MGCAWERGNPRPETAPPPHHVTPLPPGAGTAGGAQRIGAARWGHVAMSLCRSELRAASRGALRALWGSSRPPPSPPRTALCPLRALGAPWRPELRRVSPPALPAGRGRQQHRGALPAARCSRDARWEMEARRSAPSALWAVGTALPRRHRAEGRGHVWSGRAGSGAESFGLSSVGPAGGAWVLRGGIPSAFCASGLWAEGPPHPQGGMGGLEGSFQLTQPC